MTTPITPITPDDAKAAARRLRTDLAARGTTLSHSEALELVAHQLGHADWNTASAVLAPATEPSRRPAGGGQLGAPVPVLRMQSAELSRAFYVDYLGFAVEWEHRFEPDLPLYLRLVRDDARLDLSEHHGDGTPGTVVWIPIRDAAALQAELIAHRHPHSRPGIDHDAPGGPTLEVIDPSGNVLRLCQVGWSLESGED